MIRRPPRSTLSSSSAASDVYKRQICADTDRPGAYEQLKTHCDKMGVLCYGEPGSKDPVKIVQHGLAEIEKYDVKIIDTAGRHALESDLIKQMEEINAIAKPCLLYT